MAVAALAHRITVRPELWLREVDGAIGRRRRARHDGHAADGAPGRGGDVPAPARWLPTHAHRPGGRHRRRVRARSPCSADDPTSLVLGVPFLGAAAWGARHRPRRGAAGASSRLADTTVFEGQVTTATADRRARAGDETGDVVAACLEAGPAVRWRPRVGAPRPWRADGGPVAVAVAARAVRWGRHPIALVAAACTSRLGAFRTDGPRRRAGRCSSTMPLSAEFDAVDAVPRPAGLVGLHRANRQGGGQRAGRGPPVPAPATGCAGSTGGCRRGPATLHVTSTWADRDTHVLLLLDTEHDIGAATGIDGARQQPRHRRAGRRRDRRALPAGRRPGRRSSTSGGGSATCPSGAGGGTCGACSTRSSLAEPGPTSRRRRRAAAPDGGRRARRRPHAARRRAGPRPDRPPRPARAHRRRRRHAAARRRAPTDAVARRWPAGCGRWSGAAEIDHLGELGVPVVAWRGRGTLDEVLRDVSRVGVGAEGRDERRSTTLAAHRAASVGAVPVAVAGDRAASSCGRRRSRRRSLPAWDVPNGYVVHRRRRPPSWRRSSPDTGAGSCFVGGDRRRRGPRGVERAGVGRPSSSPPSPCSSATSPARWPRRCRRRQRPTRASPCAGGARRAVLAAGTVAGRPALVAALDAWAGRARSSSSSPPSAAVGAAAPGGGRRDDRLD